MAVVISLAPRLRAHKPEDRTGRPQSAAILFFTGVRYEREAEPVAADPVVRRRARAVPAGAVRPKRPRKATVARQPA